MRENPGMLSTGLCRVVHCTFASKSEQTQIDMQLPIQHGLKWSTHAGTVLAGGAGAMQHDDEGRGPRWVICGRHVQEAVPAYKEGRHFDVCGSSGQHEGLQE